MILITISLVYIAGFSVLLISDRHRGLNIFEQSGVSFGIGASLFVSLLTLQGVLLKGLSMSPSFFAVLALFLLIVVKQIVGKTLITEITSSVAESLKSVRTQFTDMSLLLRLVFTAMLLYVLLKVVAAFSLTMLHPTMAEDAVVSWDLKTKVFFANRSLVLDKGSPEFLGSALDRNIFAPLLDLFFILPYKTFPDHLSNIVSPLVYLNTALVLFGLLLRKTNLLFAALSVYIFLSLPIVFTHAFTSYHNLSFGYFLFIFTVYLSESNYPERNGRSGDICFFMILTGFLGSLIRNEGVLIFMAVIVTEIARIFIFCPRHEKGYRIKRLFASSSGVFTALLFCLFIYRYSPQASGRVGDVINSNIVGKLYSNISGELLAAPLIQAFGHPDFSLLFVFFSFTALLFFLNPKKLSATGPMYLHTMVLLIIFTLILYAFPNIFLLMSHYGFIRFTIALTPLIVYTTVYTAALLPSCRLFLTESSD